MKELHGTDLVGWWWMATIGWCIGGRLAFKPSKGQERQLHRLLAACREVYNAALQERRDAWRLARKRITVVDQFKAVTELRGVRDDVLVWGIQPLRGTLRLLDEAFQAFFRRMRNGQAPGFPRFKSGRRFNTVSWDQPRSWRADPDARTLHLQGVGVIRLPKSAPRQLRRLLARGGIPVTLTVTRRRAGTGWVWRATVGFKQVAGEPTVPANGDDSILGCDRGVKAKGTMENPGVNVAAKAGLNRALQDAALGRLAFWVAVKAENAGRRLWLVDAANTSRRCSRCNHTDKANRADQATFRCLACGYQAHADLNAAVNIAALAVACETAWAKAGSPPLVRSTPRMQRRTTDRAAAEAA
ncbi:MAG: RNA-guided endonuclease InsQ/TnpB family protein [Nitriliruptorales bacterium]